MLLRGSWKMKKYTFVLDHPSGRTWWQRLFDDATCVEVDDVRRIQPIVRALVKDRGGQIKVGDLVLGITERLGDETWERGLSLVDRAL